MPVQLIHGAARTRFFIYALAMAGFGILPGFNANAAPNPTTKLATTWTITVVATKGGAKPDGYTVVRDNTVDVGCSHPAPADASTLIVCPGDIVLWKAETKVDLASKKKHSEMLIIHEDLILFDKDGMHKQVFHASDGNPTDNGTVDTDVSLLNTPHEYHVAVYDEPTKHWYIEDPKIIIRTGTREQVIEEIKTIGTICDDIEQSPFAKGKPEEVAEANEACKKAQKKLDPLVPPK